jgi:hypothetical protein
MTNDDKQGWQQVLMLGLGHLLFFSQQLFFSLHLAQNPGGFSYHFHYVGKT